MIGLYIPEVILSRVLCNYCMEQSVLCSAFLSWWFLWISQWWECVVVLHRCLNLLAWFDTLKNLYWISCLYDILLRWFLLICTFGDCVEFFDDPVCALWNKKLCCEEGDIRWLFMQERQFRSYIKLKYSSMLLWCNNMSIGRRILGTF